MSAVDVVEAYLAALPGTHRRLAHAEWGVTVEADGLGGWPLDVGVRVADELVRAQAPALGADAGIDPWLLLHWNRQTRLVRFSSTRSGEVWVQADTPVAGLDGRAVDRLLGLVVQAAARAREYAEASRAAEAAGAAENGPDRGPHGGSGGGGGWSGLEGLARPPAGD